MDTILVIALCTVWYLVGSFGMMWVSRKIYKPFTRKDLLICFTLGGLGGVISIIAGLPHVSNDWWDKEIF